MDELLVKALKDRDDAWLAKLDAEKKAREDLELKFNRSMAAFPSSSAPHGIPRSESDELRKMLKSREAYDGFHILESKADMSIDSDAGGGAVVLPHFHAALFKRIFDLSPIRQIANVTKISTDRFKRVGSWEDVEGEWVGERTTPSDTDSPQLVNVEIPLHGVSAQPKSTQWLLDDAAVDVAEFIVSSVVNKFARLEAAAFINGDGATKPKGFLQETTAESASYTGTFGTIEYTKTGGAASFAASNPADALHALVGTLKTGYRANAKWLMNRNTASLIRRFKATDGQYLWTSSMVEGQPDRLLGWPVILAEDVPSVAANAYIAAFGDWKEAYQIVDHTKGLFVLRDPFTTKGYVKFYCTYRTGGLCVNSEAIKLLRCVS